jgi:hypothetical protein
MDRLCISCGMPLQLTKDFPLGDQSKDYCVYCARPDGSMKSYEEALEGMVEFMARLKDLEEEAAREAARQYMATMPAWKDLSAGNTS